jgi:homoserine acetyltransferase
MVAKNFFAVTICACYAAGFFAFMFPYKSAELFDAMGNLKLSAMYYGRAYDRDKNAETLYYALAKGLEAGADGYVLKYGDKFFFETDPQTRAEITKKVDDYLISQTNDLQIKAWLTEINTEYRLRRGYRDVLIKHGQTEKAAQL